jgi:hypothetical protein
MKETAQKLTAAIDDFLSLKGPDITWANLAAPGKWTNKQTHRPFN